MDRESFLAQVRRQVGRAVLPEAAAEREPFDPGPAAGVGLVARFAAELEAVSGRCHVVDGIDSAWETLLALCEEIAVREYLAWDDPFLPLPDLNRRLHERGFNRGENELPVDEAARQAAQEQLAGAQIGITGALGGLAETGSVALHCGPGRGRLASLLPPVHVALLRADQLFPTMAHFIQAHPAALQEASSFVFITGPSRTADIEQTLTLGVHGPKNLHVILIQQTGEG